jgi:hypothetical protein
VFSVEDWMQVRRTVAILGLAGALAVVWSPSLRVRAAADTLPDRLTNEEFWRLSQDSSEPNGYFQSDNLVSNEIYLQWVVPELMTRARPGGVYLGVGPEQNFTYIAAIKPRMVFITDIRRGNLCMHLMYKAIFELSKDRADFVELLFNKKRPDGLSDKSTVAEIANAFWDVNTSLEPVYKANLKRIQDHLTKTRGLPLSQDDLNGIEYIYWHFYWDGMRINYNSSSPGANSGRGGGSMAMYGDLMLLTDGSGVSRHYLSSEESFRFLKGLEERNLLVPVVGNLAGAKALRAVGQYVRDQGATVSAISSNVEQYLNQDGIWGHFCANVATMPLDERSTFIRSSRGGGGGPSGGLVNSLGSMLNETRGCGIGRLASSGVRSH